MNDAERDAWLREALRHAPDSGATPPSVLNDAILAQARAAAARPTTTRSNKREEARRQSTNPLLALWDWLARPPVAAGFASVMAATLVGLMWWDRPMDEAMPRAPAVDRIESPRAAAPTKPAAIEPAATGAAVATPPVVAEAARSQTAPAAQVQARRAKLAETERAEPANAKDGPAKERAAPTVAPNDKAAAFPAPEFQRDAPVPAPRTIVVPTPLADAKGEAAPVPSTPAPAAAPAAAPLAAAQRQAPQAAAQAVPTPPSLARGRVASDEARDLASNRLDSGAARSESARESIAEAKNDATAPTTTLAAPAVRPPAFGQPLEKKANAFPPAVAAARSEAPAEGRRALGAAALAPLAPLLAAMAGDATRVSRQSASGAWLALDPAWRSWLSELDAASAGRWRAVIDAERALDADVAKQLGSPVVLRLDGRAATTIRIDGTTAQLESQLGEPRRWQAVLEPAAAERLRALLARLPP
jgi:hypothetical protein